jgi:hypothetical protein
LRGAWIGRDDHLTRQQDPVSALAVIAAVVAGIFYSGAAGVGPR